MSATPLGAPLLQADAPRPHRYPTSSAGGEQQTSNRHRLPRGFGLSLRNPRHLEHGLRILSTPNPVTSQSHSFTIVQTSFLQIGKFLLKCRPSALVGRINATRTAVGDNGDRQWLIRTLPRKGIRFVGVVRESAMPVGEATAHPAIIDTETPELAATRRPNSAPAERRQLTVTSCELLLGAAASQRTQKT